MNTYQFESVIEDKGIIVLPEQMKLLHKHRVRLILIDLDTFPPDPVQQLTQITQKYLAITDEADLPISDIYTQREQSHERTMPIRLTHTARSGRRR